jgi:hypothetical protein
MNGSTLALGDVAFLKRRPMASCSASHLAAAKSGSSRAPYAAVAANRSGVRSSVPADAAVHIGTFFSAEPKCDRSLRLDVELSHQPAVFLMVLSDQAGELLHTAPGGLLCQLLQVFTNGRLGEHLVDFSIEPRHDA